MSTVSEAAGRAYGGESAADRDDRRRRQLLDAGLRVFGSVGYRAATVRGLCREAKIADRHFYQYFDKT
ncbi:MAG: helix-turn-helix transcriptional regulator, partial [Rhodococcus sp.]|nr:helix-turn-helix transcriptional regulator [Rhodococcus sp. (in: high G+C Gram-positive bacteria)]